MIDHEPPVKRAVVKFEPGADLTAFPAYEEAKAMESRPLEDDDRARPMPGRRDRRRRAHVRSARAVTGP